MSANVSPEAQKLYLTITKTYVFTIKQVYFSFYLNFLIVLFRIPEVSWQGQNIVVYDHVIISPPYKPENVKGTGNSEDKAILYIKNIVSILLRIP